MKSWFPWFTYCSRTCLVPMVSFFVQDCHLILSGKILMADNQREGMGETKDCSTWVFDDERRELSNALLSVDPKRRSPVS